MLIPSKVKHRKQHRGRRKGVATRGCHVDFGDYGLKAMENGWISVKQIEAARVAISREIERTGKVWVRIFPDKPVTKRAAETRMGKGKGVPQKWVAVVKPGRILFEIRGVDEEMSQECMRLASHKLPIKTKFVERF